MRLITLIFSFYVLVMATWPCADLASDDNKSAIEHSHEHGDDPTDLCSPFCSCQCCQINMQMPIASNSVALPLTLVDNQSIYNGNLPDSFGNSLFIPPRA